MRISKPLGLGLFIAAIVVCTLAFAVAPVLIALGAVSFSMPGAPALWPDVPVLEGTTQDVGDAVTWRIFNQAQADQKSKMETLRLRSSKAPADVAAFYAVERMKPLGWTPGLAHKNGCDQDKYEGQPRALCQFVKKNEEGREITLDVTARVDEKTKNTLLNYTRFTGSLTEPAAARTPTRGP